MASASLWNRVVIIGIACAAFMTPDRLFSSTELSRPFNLDEAKCIFKQLPADDIKTLKSIRLSSKRLKQIVDQIYPNMFHTSTVTPKNLKRFKEMLTHLKKKPLRRTKPIPPLIIHFSFQGIKLTKTILKALEILSTSELQILNCTLSKDFVSGLKLLPQVTSLSIVQSRFGRSLWKPKDFELPQNLRHLCINGVEIPQNQGVRIYDLESLEELHLSQNTIKSGVKIQYLANLKEINLASNGIKGPALKSLARFAQLEHLSLDHNPEVRAEDLMTIELLSLRKLSLKDTRINSEDIPKLVQHFAELQEIHVGFMRLSMKDLESAKRANPDIKIMADFCRVE